MKPEALPRYEHPNVLVVKDTFNEPTSCFNGLPHYKVKCGALSHGGSEASLIGIDNVLAHFGMLMQECHRLRWIITQVDKHAGGTLVHDVVEATQNDFERIPVEPPATKSSPQAVGRERGREAE